MLTTIRPRSDGPPLADLSRPGWLVAEWEIALADVRLPEMPIGIVTLKANGDVEIRSHLSERVRTKAYWHYNSTTKQLCIKNRNRLGTEPIKLRVAPIEGSDPPQLRVEGEEYVGSPSFTYTRR